MSFDDESFVDMSCSLQNTSGGGGIGVPAGRPTEDRVGRDTCRKYNNNKHQPRTNDHRKDSGFEGLVSVCRFRC